MSNNITRNEIAESIFKEIGLSRSECNEFVDTIVEYLITGIINDEIVKIASFGTFKLRQKKQREGRNPKTKEPAVISSRKVILFRISQQLKEKLNSE
tara:strand:- start:457 stop:747 length:291 start_codon:yes stop_codon:yes gene_type:complete